MNIVLLAVQGAGKGTIAKELQKKYNYVHISVGDILRERASINDELGIKIKELIDNGIFVSDDIIFEAIEHKITQPECRNGYILDGFPRSLEQAIGYNEILKKLNKDIGIVINLTIPNEILLNRTLGRRLCSECGSIYNIYDEKFKPLKDNICNNCGGSLYKRDDDNEESIKKRVDTYFKVTAPIIDYYKEQGILYEVESKELQPALNAIESILKKLGDNRD